jgi:hypothetical protein
MRANPVIQRQALGCAFAPPAPPTVPVQPWSPDEGYNGPRATVCPTFTANLPEVTESARAWGHWQKGELSHFTGGVPATEELLERLEEMDHAVGEKEAADRAKLIRDAKKDG